MTMVNYLQAATLSLLLSVCIQLRYSTNYTGYFSEVLNIGNCVLIGIPTLSIPILVLVVYCKNNYSGKEENLH